MKQHNLLGGIILFLCSLNFMSCSDEPEDLIMWDFVCHNIGIQVVNANGDDLLNPDTPGSIAHSGIKALFKKQVYEKDSTINAITPRYLLPHWKGLYASETDGKYTLFFGEFTPESSFHGEEFVIDWNDGTQDVISFNLYITWKKDEPTVHRALYFKGQEIEGLNLTIVK